MEQVDFAIGAKVEHPKFGEGIVTKKTLTTTRVFFSIKETRRLPTVILI